MWTIVLSEVGSAYHFIGADMFKSKEKQLDPWTGTGLRLL